MPAHGFAAFYFGFHGTLVSTPSIPPLVIVETTVAAQLYAPGLHEIDCLGDDCPALVIPMTTEPNATDAWNPQTHVLYLRLATMARITSDVGANGWDADSIADFGDTLSLLAIQPQDESHNPIPGHFVLPDGAGPGTMLDIADIPPSSTTTTSTAPGASTTTTSTQPAGSTTTSTTTPPVEVCDNCIDDDLDGRVDFEQVSCCQPSLRRTLVFRDARLAPTKSGTRLDLTVLVAGATLLDVLQTVGPIVQLRGADGRALLCVPIEHGGIRGRKQDRFILNDPHETFPELLGITRFTLRATRDGVLAHLAGRHVRMPMPPAGLLHLALGAGDFTAPGFCSSDAAELRRVHKSGLRGP